MRRRAKVDANQEAIVDAYRVAGWSVRSTAPLGEGFPDLVVSPPWDADYVFLVEVKIPKGKSRQKQDAFALAFPVKVVRTIDDAIAHMRAAYEQRVA